MGGLRTFGGALRSAACVVVLPLGLMFASLGAIVRALRGGTPRQVHGWYTAFARFGIRVAGTDFEVNGAEHVEPGAHYVVVCNHESNWDPFVVLAGLPDLPLRFVIKRQLMNIPVFGRALALSGNIQVNRTGSKEDVERVRDGMSHRPDGVSVLFFAEGTRARDGAFREFRKGAFATALQFGLPILPIAVAGTYRIWQPETAVIRPGVAAVEVGAPIPVDGLGWDDRDALRQQTHEAVGKLRARARQRVRERGFDPGGSD